MAPPSDRDLRGRVRAAPVALLPPAGPRGLREAIAVNGGAAGASGGSEQRDLESGRSSGRPLDRGCSVACAKLSLTRSPHTDIPLFWRWGSSRRRGPAAPPTRWEAGLGERRSVGARPAEPGREGPAAARACRCALGSPRPQERRTGGILVSSCGRRGQPGDPDLSRLGGQASDGTNSGPTPSLCTARF